MIKNKLRLYCGAVAENRAAALKFCFLLYVCPFIAHTQVIRVSPAFCTAEDTVTIIYDANEGNMGLKNATPPIFAHTGVITSKSSSSNDWRYVIGNWGIADSRVLMTPLGNQLYQIRYPVRKFYNVPDSENILKMAFVFRNTNGSLVGRDASGGDIFYPVYEKNNQLQGQRILPSTDYSFLKKDSSFTLQYECSKAASIRIFRNGALIDSITGKTYKRLFVCDAEGQFDIRIVCSDGTTSLENAFRYFVGIRTPVVDAPAGTEPGIRITSPLSARLALMAPGKQQVFVLGDFNNYLPDTAFLMKRTPAGDVFWLDIRPLKPGFSHTYQYLVDGTIKIADPMSTLVLDPWNDSGIDANTFPDLPSYPFGKTTEQVTVLQTTPEAYIWQTPHIEKPKKEQLLIYELLLRDFDNTHRFTAVLEKLDTLKKMGVNAISLMPVNEFEGNSSWGYNTSFAMAVDKYYGPANRLKELIDSAHNKGIAIILDVVFNHVFGQSPLAKLYWDAGLNKPATNSPFLNTDARHPFNVGYDVNHESPFTKRWVKQVLKYWLEEFHVDGFRFDLSKGFTQKYSGNDANAFAAYDASRIKILKEYAQHIRSLDSNNITILEHFADNTEEKELAEAGMLLWGNMNYAFNQATMGYTGNDLSGAWSNTRGWNSQSLIAYMESHDEERLMYKNLQYGNTSSGYSVKDLSTALARQEMAAAFLLMIPGPKMIWQFGELGYDYSINYCRNGTVNPNCRLDEKPVRWDYEQDPRRIRIRQTIANIQAFKQATQITVQSTPVLNVGEGFIKSIRYSLQDLNVLLLGNFDVKSQNTRPQFAHTGWWYDILTNDSIWVADVQVDMNLKAGEFHLWADQKQPTAAENHLHKKMDLVVYPNPAKRNFNLFGSLEIKSCWLMDGLGRYYPLTLSTQDHQLYVCETPASIPAGMYFLKICTTSNELKLAKLILE